MVLKEKTVDYKEVDEGEVIEHVFKVLNEGDQPLQIEKVKPGKYQELPGEDHENRQCLLQRSKPSD
jgi:hypothetical protein